MKTAPLFLAFIIVISTVLPAAVWADGFFTSMKGKTLGLPDQKAVISWDGTQQTMILSSAVRSQDIDNFAWVIPIQSRTKPEVSAGAAEVFKHLRYFFEGPPPEHFVSTLGPESDLEVIETKEIDVYDITLLKVGNTRVLAEWLEDNGYKLPSGSERVLSHYTVADSCYFAAVRIDLKNQYESEIEEVESVFAKLQEETQALCSKVNTALEQKGIRGRVNSVERLPEAWEMEYVLRAELNAEYNPLRLPILAVHDLGSGISVKERLFVNPRLRSRYERNPGALSVKPASARIAFVYEDDVYTGLSNFNPPTDSQPSTWFHAGMGKRAKETGYFNPEEMPLLKDYFTYREEPDLKTAIQQEIEKKLVEFSEFINKNLRADVQQCQQSLRDLYYPASQLSPQPPRDRIPFPSKLHSKAVQQTLSSSNEKFERLREAISALNTGAATPLKFKFQPTQPHYPLVISSVHSGTTRVDVYVLAEKEQIDKHGVLRKQAAKKISAELKTRIGEQFDLSRTGYVTRFTYFGQLQSLLQDAVFVPVSD